MVGPPCIIAPFPNPALPFIHLQVNALEHVQGSAAAWEGVMSSLIRCFLVSRMEKHWQQEYDKDSRKYVPHRRESLLSCTSMRHMRLANLLTCTCDTCLRCGASISCAMRVQWAWLHAAHLQHVPERMTWSAKRQGKVCRPEWRLWHLQVAVRGPAPHHRRHHARAAHHPEGHRCEDWRTVSRLAKLRYSKMTVILGLPASPNADVHPLRVSCGSGNI